MLIQIIHEFRVQLQTGISTVNAVIPVRVYLHVKLLVGLHEGFR